MTNFKLIACDLDGTLLDTDMNVSETNLNAIKTLLSRGIAVVPTTGRAFYQMPKAIWDNPDIRYYINSNGAVIKDKLTNTRYECCIDKPQILGALEVLNNIGALMIFHHNDRTYVDSSRLTAAEFSSHAVSPEYQLLMNGWAEHLTDFDGFVKNADSAEMFATFYKSKAEADACQRELDALGLYTVRMSEQYMEVFCHGAGKGNALSRLIGIVKADRGQVIGIGDSKNDVTLLDGSGLALATSNCQDALKPHANRIICSNDEHILNYLLKFVL